MTRTLICLYVLGCFCSYNIGFYRGSVFATEKSIEFMEKIEARLDESIEKIEGYEMNMRKQKGRDGQ